MSTLHRAARAYAGRWRWPVLPLVPGCKSPIGRLVPRGVYDATATAEVIDHWWAIEPNANVGISVGYFGVVLDVDPRNGGDDTLAELEARHGPLPETLTALTGGGGQHYYFSRRVGTDYPSSLGAGLDVKRMGGYVVAPPSLHPNGTTYVWDAGCHPIDTALAPAPAWMSPAPAQHREPLGHAVGPVQGCFLARCFRECNWLGRAVGELKVWVRCPWLADHSVDFRGIRTGDGRDSSTVVLAPTEHTRLGAFACAHAHCAGKNTEDVLRAVPSDVLHTIACEMHKDANQATRIASKYHGV